MLNKKIIFAVAFVLSQSAYALNLQGYRFTDSYRYSLLDDSLMEKFDGNYVGTASFGHVNSPFYYSDTYLHDKRKDIIDGNNVLTAGFTYYLNKNVSMGIDLNAVNNTVFNDTYTTMGDTVLKSKINLRRTKTFSFSLNPQIFLPTGEEDNFSTMGSVSGSLSAVVEKSFSNRFHVLASLGALSSKDNQYVDVDYRQLALAQLGFSYDVTDRFNLNLEAFRNIPLVNDTLQDEGKYYLTGKHKTHKNFSTYFGAGITGWGDVQRDTYSAFAGIKFHAAAPVAAVAMVQQRQTIRVPSKEIYFAHDRYQLTDDEKKKLDEYAEYSFDMGNEVEMITIEGYASRVGQPAYNMNLSHQRAQAAKDYLVMKGVREDLITTEGYGDTTPQVPEESLNRKVQFKFQNVK